MRLGSRALLAGLAAREVRMVGGQLANVELETVATALKDPWKALQKK